MMKLGMIIDELIERGFDAYPHTSIKNGVLFDGIIIYSNKNIASVIYTDAIFEKAKIEGWSFDEVVSCVIRKYEANLLVDFDVKEFVNRDFVLSHLYIGLQKVSTQELVKRKTDFEGIESYLYIRKDRNNGEIYTTKIHKGILLIANITEEEAWLYAEKNTKKDTVIKSMASIMAEMLEVEYTEEMEESEPIFIVTNKIKERGASGILNKEMLSEFGKKYHINKVVVMPSSIHEMLLIPYTEGTSLEMYSAMVQIVNNSEVAPEERLTDRAYILKV